MGNKERSERIEALKKNLENLLVHKGDISELMKRQGIKKRARNANTVSDFKKELVKQLDVADRLLTPPRPEEKKLRNIVEEIKNRVLDEVSSLGKELTGYNNAKPLKQLWLRIQDWVTNSAIPWLKNHVSLLNQNWGLRLDLTTPTDSKNPDADLMVQLSNGSKNFHDVALFVEPKLLAKLTKLEQNTYKDPVSSSNKNSSEAGVQVDSEDSEPPLSKFSIQ